MSAPLSYIRMRKCSALYWASLLAVLVINRALGILVIHFVTAIATILSIALLMVLFQDGPSMVSPNFKANCSSIFAFVAKQLSVSMVIWGIFQSGVFD